MQKIVAVVIVLLFICSCESSSSTSTCTGPTERALKLIDSTVTSGEVSKEKYIALVADARAKLELMQKCLPVQELNGERNEHLRNALIHFDEALDVDSWNTNPDRKRYWELARAELDKTN